jgi:hypothetical protein
MPLYDDHMISRRRWQILALITMALIGIGLGVWLLRTGFATLGCLCIGVFLWRGQQFVVWFISSVNAPSDRTSPMTSKLERLLLSVVCLLGAAVCAVGVYLWRLWPEEWQAGLVFILFGSLVLAPVTIKEIQSRRKTLAQVPAATTEQCL